MPRQLISKLAVFALVLALLASAGCAGSFQEKPASYVHFFVVPKALPDGTSSDQATRALCAWLCEKAGGYTQVKDAPGGWVNENGDVETQEQTCFLVSAPVNLKAEIQTFLMKEFREREAYVVVWQGL